MLWMVSKHHTQGRGARCVFMLVNFMGEGGRHSGLLYLAIKVGDGPLLFLGISWQVVVFLLTGSGIVKSSQV